MIYNFIHDYIIVLIPNTSYCNFVTLSIFVTESVLYYFATLCTSVSVTLLCYFVTYCTFICCITFITSCIRVCINLWYSFDKSCKFDYVNLLFLFLLRFVRLSLILCCIILFIACVVILPVFSHILLRIFVKANVLKFSNCMVSGTLLKRLNLRRHQSSLYRRL